jgi:hypothetical protein
VTPEQSAIAALAGFIQVCILGAARWLVAEREKDRATCDARIAKLETKLDESASLLHKQAESQQKQIDAQSALLEQQAHLIRTLQGTRAP